PILFLIYINESSTCCPELKSLYLFADDAKCFAAIKSVSDCVTFQKSLNSIALWSNKWQLSLAVDKCKIIYFSNNKVASLEYIYIINSLPLLTVTYIIDLGV